ncbi:MAG: type IV secretion system DNA-binding domain-containing protein [Parachlamydiaceae bacterium]|nr:type IV secretion system DNA-binding domain-containing protein [Parachlamydiaceae bacterium]
MWWLFYSIFTKPISIRKHLWARVTKTIIGNTLTKIILAEQDPEIAERISKAFGDCEVKEFNEGISYGAHEARDGVNLSTQTKSSPIVSPSKILSLPKNTAFVKLPGNYPIVKVRLKIAKSNKGSNNAYKRTLLS